MSWSSGLKSFREISLRLVFVLNGFYVCVYFLGFLIVLFHVGLVIAEFSHEGADLVYMLSVFWEGEWFRRDDLIYCLCYSLLLLNFIDMGFCLIQVFVGIIC